MGINNILKPKSSRILNQSGYTIIELMTVLAITGFLIMAVGIGLSVFFAKFNEITKWEELQKSSFECLDQIRSGIKTPGDDLYGVANAKGIEFPGGVYNSTPSRGFTAYHDGGEGHTNDKVEFEFVDHCIRARIVYGGTSSASRIYLFPTQKQMEYITIEKCSFSMLEQTKISDKINRTLIGVNLEAKVKVAKNKYRYIKYNTKIVNKPF